MKLIFMQKTIDVNGGMMTWNKLLAALLCIITFTYGNMGYADEDEPVQVTIIHEETSFQPGRPFWAAVRMEISDGWHSFWKDPQDEDFMTNFEWTIPSGFTVGPIVRPIPKEIEAQGATRFAYEGDVLFLVKITPPESYSSAEAIPLGVEASWVVCSDGLCLPGSADVSTKIAMSKEEPVLHPDWGNLFTTARAQLPEDLIAMADETEVPGVKAQESSPVSDFTGGVALAIVFAFVGGLILNLMPCVLPVVSFKILSFVKMAGQSRAQTFKHGVAFSAGVIVSFWVLASALLILQAYGRSVGWGFQLQEPIFVGALATVMLVLGLSMFGVFEMGTSVMSMASQAQSTAHGETLFASFLGGVLATAVATPCTGPFLGSAIGFAVTQPAVWSLLIFTALGLGMAFPYLLLAGFPALLRFMPKPGNWMLVFKEVMGFLMFATVLWLVWVFGAQTNTVSLTLLLAGFFMISVGCWIYGKWATIQYARLARTVALAFALVFGAMGGYIIFSASTVFAELPGDQTTSTSHSGWEPFSRERVKQLRAEGKPVFIDFTAKWCLICQANHLILSMPEVEKAMVEKGVVRMKADWTKSDPVITEELKKFGRNGVPLYIYYGDAEEPTILPQVLTPDTILKNISEA